MRSLNFLRVRPSKKIADGFGMLLYAFQKSSTVAISQSCDMLSSYDLEFLSGARCSQITHSCSRKCGPPVGIAMVCGRALSDAPVSASPRGVRYRAVLSID